VISDLPRLMREGTPIEWKQVLNVMFDWVWVGENNCRHHAASGLSDLTDGNEGGELCWWGG
jgi:hypothetical protein